MIAIKNPVILYWLHTSGILDRIQAKFEEEYDVQITLQYLITSSEKETPAREMMERFNKEIEEEMSLYKIESMENLYEEGHKQIRSFFKTQPQDKLRIINCQAESKEIRKFLSSNSFSNLLLEFNNYYQLLNLTYVFVEQSISEEVMRVISKNEMNDSLNEETIYYKEPELKVEDVTLGSKIGEFEGGELWNCKHKSIPHTYIKFRDTQWEEGAKIKLLHTSNPNYFPSLNLFAPIQPLKPSISKLNQLLSFLEVLEKKYPTHYPTSDSIFEVDNKLVIFTKENNYKINLGWLCYHVVHGQISYQAYLRWVKHNPNSQIAKYNLEPEQEYSMRSL